MPGRLQNAVEWAYEFGSDFAVGIGGERARRYYPIFAAFFLFILFSNWSGLVPPIGKIEQLRAPTSDVNVTIGLALTSFVLFQGEGFRRLGVRGYLGKFFPIGEFRHGLGAGLLAMYVGIIELFLEFVKPVTLSMRLFGNIYGGEVALAVISALTLALVPVALVGLEALLNLIQALIFSVLTLMFILIAIEGHGSEEHRSGRSRRHRSRSSGARRRRQPSARGGLTAHHATTRPLGRSRGGQLMTSEHIGAGLAALGVIGPGIGIGILAGMSSNAIGRNPDAAGQIRGLAIILAGFAEGLGVLAIVVGLLALFLKVGRTRRSDAVNPLAAVAAAAAPASEASGLSINFFWVIVAALNFIVFLALIWRFGFDPIANILAERKARIEQGLADAEQARQDRDGGGGGARAGRSREARREAERADRRGPEGRRGPARRRTSPPPARSWTGCASRPRPTSSPNGTAPWPTCGPRSPTWPSRPPGKSSARR